MLNNLDDIEREQLKKKIKRLIISGEENYEPKLIIKSKI